MSIVDEISPDFMGDNLISLSLNIETANPIALKAVVIDVDVSAADPEGLVLPLELIIRPPTNANIIRRHFTDRIPATISFRPLEGGEHLVLLREMAHNRYTGTLTIEVEGDSLTDRNLL